MSDTPHLGITFYLHMYMIRTDTKAFSVSLQLQWTPRKPQDQTWKQQQYSGYSASQF